MLNKVSYCKTHLEPGTQGKNKHNDPIFLSQIFNVCYMAVTCHLVGTKPIYYFDTGMQHIPFPWMQLHFLVSSKC